MLNKTVKQLYGCNPKLYAFDDVASVTKGYAKELFGKQVGPTPAHIGIEVEIEHAENYDMLDRALWRIESDGSLRNGMELITCPVRDENLYYALASLDSFFNANREAEFSHRCSMHIHINAASMTYEQLVVFMGFYLTVENIFFDAFFPHRKGNNYCYPLTNVELTTDDLDKSRLSKEVWKYAALNAANLRTYGTLEFRQHCGTKSVEQLLVWIKTILNIYNYAQKTSLKEFTAALYELNTTSGYNEYVRRALPDWNVPISTDNMYDSVTAAKYFLSKQEV